MYHLLVKYDGWATGKDFLPQEGIFEYTSEEAKQRFRPNGELDVELITMIPALFASETGGTGNQRARVGRIYRLESINRTVRIEYGFYDAISPIPSLSLEELSSELAIDSWEFSRTHWAIKNIDLLGTLLREPPGISIAPKVFSLERSSVDRALISVMIPFAPEFQEVFLTIKQTSESMNLTCLRADDILRHDAIIQDIVSLINRSHIVVCDCSTRNANVFYEAGIAHTLGREVVLISQSEGDIPFDLRHLRYIRYLNNGEGLQQLAEQLRKRFETLVG